MKILDKTRFIKKITILTLVIFFTTYFGVFLINMNMDGDMHPHCPFMIGSSICNMTIADHYLAASTVFTALPQLNTFIFLSLIVLGFLSLLIFIPKLFAPPPLKLKPFNLLKYIPLHSSLQEVFSNGILNPKTF